MAAVDKEELERILRICYKEFFALKEEHGLDIFPVFNTLPSKKDYPDYYDIIKTPVSFNTLKKRVPHYTEPQPFLNDIVQIAWNARVYNTPDSEIYKYARILDKHIREKTFPRLKKKYPEIKYPYLGPLPEGDDEKVQLSMKKTQDDTDSQKSVTRKIIIKRPAEPKPSPMEKEKERQKIKVVETPKVIKQSSMAVSRNETQNIIQQSASQLELQQQQQQQAYNNAQQIPIQQPYRQRAMNIQTQRYNIDSERGRGRPRKIPRPMDYSPGPGGHSQSGTPQYSKTIQPKAHIRRGRPPVIDLPYLQRIKNILKYLKKERDPNHKLLTAPFERIPLELEDGTTRDIINNPICLDDVRKKAKWRKYKDFSSFQYDMNVVIANYRMMYQNDVNKLRMLNNVENVYASLARTELAKPDRSFLPEGEVRVPLDEVKVNGFTVHIGDWVLLRNPNDETKPTVGQIFRLWSMPDGNTWLNACWYFRPEQTVHRVDRLFYKHEVMKTGQYRDHLVSDIVGKCYVVHFTRYQRGDPDVAHEGPLFICEFRYNESDKVFNKIRTWKACLPEELRDQDEPTIPVTGRKFFKYPSPIRHLLPSNANVNDQIPEPKMGAATAPPLVGAVYLRPRLARDDLGEYSTSRDCPKHIIRPGDPHEEGKIDFEMGTMISQGYNGPKNTNPHKSSMRSSRSSTSLANSDRNSPAYLEHQTGGSDITGLMNLKNNDSLTVHKLKQRQLQKLQEQQLQQRQQLKNQASGYNLATTFNNLAAEVSKSSLSPIVVNTPNSYILPISIAKSIQVLQRTDTSNEASRTLNSVVPTKRSRSEILWFAAPSIRIEERLLNSGNLPSDFSMNEIYPWNKKVKLDYDEVEEEVLDHVRATRHNRKDILEDEEVYKLPENIEDKKEENKISGTYVTGLRPSAKYMAFRLSSEEVL